MPSSAARISRYPNNLNTDCEACADRLKAVVLKDCRVCSMSMLAPSSLASAAVRLSAPLVSRLILVVEKSCWTEMTLMAAVSFEDSCVSLLTPLSRLPMSNLMSLASAHFLPSPVNVRFCLPRSIHAHVAGIRVKPSDGNLTAFKGDREGVFCQKVVTLVPGGAGQGIDLSQKPLILGRKSFAVSCDCRIDRHTYLHL